MYEDAEVLDRVGGCFRVASRRNGANFPIPLSIMSPPQALRVGAMRARPACVFGPVDLPPWKRQRALPAPL